MLQTATPRAPAPTKALPQSRQPCILRVQSQQWEPVQESANEPPSRSRAPLEHPDEDISPSSRFVWTLPRQLKPRSARAPTGSAETQNGSCASGPSPHATAHPNLRSSKKFSGLDEHRREIAAARRASVPPPCRTVARGHKLRSSPPHHVLCPTTPRPTPESSPSPFPSTGAPSEWTVLLRVRHCAASLLSPTDRRSDFV